MTTRELAMTVEELQKLHLGAEEGTVGKGGDSPTE